MRALSSAVRQNQSWTGRQCGCYYSTHTRVGGSGPCDLPGQRHNTTVGRRLVTDAAHSLLSFPSGHVALVAATVTIVVVVAPSAPKRLSARHPPRLRQNQVCRDAGTVVALEWHWPHRCDRWSVDRRGVHAELASRSTGSDLPGERSDFGTSPTGGMTMTGAG